MRLFRQHLALSRIAILSRRYRLVLLALPLAAAAPLHAQWTPTWGDDFNGTAGSSYDTSKWFNQVKQNTGNVWGDSTVQSTTDSRTNSYLDGNGNLVIALTYDSATGQYYSARLTTAGKYDVGPYGQIESRLITPGALGSGAAFWALGADLQNQGTPWPWAGELDIMENQAKTPGHSASTIHGGQTDGGTFYEYGGLSEPVDLTGGAVFSGGFHVFTVQWKPYHLFYLLDGIPYGDVNLADLGATDQWPLEQAIDLLLSTGAGGQNYAAPVPSTLPSNLTVDYVHYAKWSAGVPGAVSGLTANATNSNAVSLNWAASSSSGVTYDIYASTTPNTPTSSATLVAQNVTGTSYKHLGLQPGTMYYYTVTAASFGGESSAATAAALTQAAGNSTGILLSAGGYASGNYMASNFVLGGSTNFRLHAPIDKSLVSNPAPDQVYDTERFGAAAWTITGLTPGALYQVRTHFIEGSHPSTGQRAFNVSINSQQVLTNYDIFQDAQATNRVVVKSFNTRADEYGLIELQTTAGTNGAPDTNPTISAIDILPSTDSSNLVGAAPGTTTNLSIDSGGGVVGSFIADKDFNGGDVATSAATIDTSATNAAPGAVYQSQRYVPFTYVLTGLAAGATYDVRMHFAETYTGITGTGQRLFNVNVNNQPALSNFDIYAQAPGLNKAVVRDFSTKADMYGQIIAQFIYGGVEQPQINGIEALQTAAAVQTPAAPTGLTGTYSNSAVNLSWTASTSTGVTYSVYRGTSAIAPAAIKAGLTATTYIDGSAVSGTTYNYYVTAVNGSGATSLHSNLVAVSTGSSAPPATDVFAVDAGSSASVGSFAADTSFLGGSPYTNVGVNVATAGVAYAAPAALYQTQRQGEFSYKISGLAPGSAHTVRLHFAEIWFSQSGQRKFNIAIGTQTILRDFDIVQAAGSNLKAVVQSISVTADSNGAITVTFTRGSVDQPTLAGIEVQ